MYCKYFGFREKPFNVTPDPAFIFLAGTHKEAFAHLLYGIDNHLGFIEIAGEVGIGKTTVLRTLLCQLDAKNYRTAFIFNPSLSADGLLQSINREYGIPWQGLGREELVEVLNQFLLEQNAAGITVVLIIDEAQNLQRDVLERIRLISNLETERDKLIQIVLSGQPELEQILERHELRQLKQRIAVRYHFRPLDLVDVGEYINHRLLVAGGGDSVNFTAGACKRIFRYSGGLPRLINIVCDRVLLLAYAHGRRDISSRMVAAAVNDISNLERPRLLSGRLFPVVSLLLVGAIATVVVGFPHVLNRSFTASRELPGKAMASAPASARDLSAELRRVMAGVSEGESAVQAFNALAAMWRTRPITVTSSSEKFAEPEQLASMRSLQVARFSGSLGALLRMNSPAMLEIRVPGTAGKRYLALTGLENGRLLIAPSLSGGSSLTAAELDSVWSGRALLLWKDYLEIPQGLKPGKQGPAVVRLQRLLRDAGVYRGHLDGLYGRPTAAAVAKFQAEQGLEPDGMAGKQTVMLLYRSTGGFFAPCLANKGGMPGR